MSFQAYLDNIQTKTGKSPADFKVMAAGKGLADASGIAHSTDLVTSRSKLAAYLARCEAKPAFQRALATQMATCRK